MNTLRFIQANARFLAVGALLTFCSSFGQTYFISIFAGEIQAEFGLSHGAWGGIYMIGTLASAAVMVWAGGLTDIFRVRVLGGVVLACLALACISAAAVPNAWALPFVIFFLRLMGQGMSSHVATVAMARWFVAARGRALAVASFGFSIGEALLPILFVAIMAWVGWRGSWVIAALLALLAIPAVVTMLRQERTPQSTAHENQSFGLQGRFWTRNQVLRHPLFWLLLPILLGPSAFGTAFFFQQVHLAEVKGWTHLELVALFPIYTSVAVVAMAISGIAIDRFGTARLMPFFTLPLAVGFYLLGAAQNLSGAAVAVAFMGITSGIQATLPSAFWAEFFGTRHLGSIKAMATAVMVLGSAIGPGLTGWIIDRGINFPDQMVYIAVYFCLAATLAWLGISRVRSQLPVTP